MLLLPERISEVVEEVMYWRKANHLHQWFVDNCQDGQDDCREAYVSTSQLQELLNLINVVLNDNSKAEDLLPCQSGFFFGGTDYDEWYFANLKETKKVLEEELSTEHSSDYYYTSSW